MLCTTFHGALHNTCTGFGNKLWNSYLRLTMMGVAQSCRRDDRRENFEVYVVYRGCYLANGYLSNENFYMYSPVCRMPVYSLKHSHVHTPVFLHNMCASCCLLVHSPALPIQHYYSSTGTISQVPLDQPNIPACSGKWVLTPAQYCRTPG